MISVFVKRYTRLIRTVLDKFAKWKKAHDEIKLMNKV